MSQETVDQKLREWNETWFGSNKSIEAQKDDDLENEHDIHNASRHG